MSTTSTDPSPAAPGAPAPITARAVDAVKTYGEGDTSGERPGSGLRRVRGGAFTAIMGPSGSGKTTLMHCMAGLDASERQRLDRRLRPDHLKDNDLTRLRRDRVGFVFQAFNLVPTLSAEENIVSHSRWRATIQRPGVDRRGRVATVGLADRLPTARASCPAVNGSGRRGPSTGQPAGHHLRRRADWQPRPRAGAEVLAFLRRAVDEYGQTVVMVTHDPVAACYADRPVPGRRHFVDEMRSPPPACGRLHEDLRGLITAARHPDGPAGPTSAA